MRSRRFASIFSLTILLILLGGCGNGRVTTPSGPQAYEFSVTAPATGSGTVTSTPKGIHCPGTCTATFTQGVKVQLAATPANNYFFEGWSGACSGNGLCTVTMSATQSATATFTPGETLTVAITGTGTGTVTSNPAGINCPTTCTATFPQETNVALSASAALNNVFTSWTGACTGSAGCSVTLSEADAVTASFLTNVVTPPPVAALVYVSSSVSGSSTSQIEAYSADSTGQLTPVIGSPFAANIVSLAANNNFLFGTDGVSLYSYSIAPDGSITKVDSINVRKHNSPLSCSGGPAYLFVDRTGVTLYNLDYLSDCANNSYQETSIGAGGALTYLGATSNSTPIFERALTFTGDNKYAFGASCYHWFPEIYGFARNADGTLTLVTPLNTLAQLPAGGVYCPWWASADTANHLAVSVTPLDSSTQQQIGNPQLAVYTIDASGNATTSSTSSNMPQIAGNLVNELAVSPAGSFLAVGEDLGLEVFNFNGANPVTKLSGLVTNDPIDEVRWDNQNHLYALSTTSGDVHVFTVSGSGVVEAPGSPYQIAGAGYLTVLQRN